MQNKFVLHSAFIVQRFLEGCVLRDGLRPSDGIAPGGLGAAFGKLRALMGGRGIWALGDQATLSLGNFLTNILLIRHLAKDQFGIYAVLFSLLLFLNNLHTSLVTYPLSITASTGELAKHRRRTVGSVGITLLLAFPFFVIVAIATRMVASFSLVPWVLAAMVLWQVQETLRRAMMARLQHRRAVLGDAISYLGQAVALWLIIRHGTLSPAIAFGAIACTSGIAALVQAIQLIFFFDIEEPAASSVTPDESEIGESFTSQAFEHWSLGRWVLLTNLISLITVYATPWILMFFHGAGEVATYQALANLLGVSNPILTSMSGLIVPVVAIASAQRGIQAARRAAFSYAAQGAGLLLPYFALLAIVPQFALRMFYGANSPYLSFTTPLRLMVAVYTLFYFSQMIAAFLNGLGHSRWTFFAQVGAAMTNAMICLPLAAIVGLYGAIWGGIFPMLVQLAICLYFVRLLLSPKNPEDSGRLLAVGLLQPMAEGAR
jgi:O-antigen/teichoic acid export membrane protein